MRLRSLYVVVALSLLLSSAALAQSNHWKTFVVPETGARAEVPVSIFIEDARRPDAGYSRRFLTSDGRASLTIQSFSNPINDTPRAFLKKKKPPSDIIYQRVTPRFFVASSIRNEKIWYNRCNRSKHYMHCILINYPAAEKHQWDGVVARISYSLASHQL